MSDQYFTAQSTSLTVKRGGALAIYAGDLPRKNADGTTNLCMRWPLLIIPPRMFENEQELAERVAKLLNDNAHLFFESARTGQPG